MREREALFSDFVSDVRRKEKEEKSQQKEKVGIPWRCEVCSLFHDGLQHFDRRRKVDKQPVKIYLVLRKIYHEFVDRIDNSIPRVTI